MGQVIYQDYVLIAPFSGRKDLSSRIFSLPVSGVGRISALINGMDNELKSQRDGFWPCRSRSYLFELLYYINYSYIYIDQTDASLVSERDYFSEAVEYLNEHMRDHMTLEKITKELSINRNRLNEIFVEKTSSTCMNYFMQMRIELAKLMLKGTELMINEIGDRVGYPDANYFTKVFRQKTGMTPTEYRKKTT